jgi:chromosome segregation ATPase
LTKTTEELNKRENTVEFLQMKLDEVNQKLSNDQSPHIQQEYDSLVSQYHELSNSYSALQAELKTSDMERAHLEHTIIQYDAKLRDLETIREGLEYEKIELDNKYKNLMLEFNLLDESYKHKEKELRMLSANAQEEQEFLHTQIDTKEKMIQTMHSINKELHSNIETNKVHNIAIPSKLTFQSEEVLHLKPKESPIKGYQPANEELYSKIAAITLEKTQVKLCVI